MSDNKTWGSTVMGWFVVRDQAEGSVEPESVPVDDGAEAPQPDVPVFNAPPPPAPGGKVDFEQVFEAAGIDGEERQRVSRTLELLTSLPPDTDAGVKKQIVMASLRAFGVPIEKIIEAGASELQALEGYIRAGAGDTEKVTTEADLRIKQYEEEIVKLRTVMQERVSEQQSVVRSCNEKKLEVQKVLEFFGQEAVARVVRESPRLHEPSGS
ncbi:MAG: hypothetical protein QOC81_2243 [Thermoanaerobaculia bacterium]|jgi:hypothetical protein|nr:hypothetical protein [Thermoanaerobaculia bacterium]